MDPDELSKSLQYRFDDPNLLALALTHSSYAAETSDVLDNERLEFLGDAVLGLAITTKLYVDYPDLAEGLMAKVRASVVNEESLARAARRLGLGAHLRIGKGEDASGGRNKASILSDAIEALLGAVYLDSSYDEAAAMVIRLLGDETDRQATDPGGQDYKTRLQELLAQSGQRPRYIASSTGPDHERHYQVELFVADRHLASGAGKSKKVAEQQAARDAMALLDAPASEPFDA